MSPAVIVSSNHDRPRVWVVCVRIDNAGKSYFVSQLDAFQTIEPMLVAWEDGRTEDGPRARLVGSEFSRNFPFRGGYRLRRMLDTVASRIRRNSFGARPDERQAFEQIAVEAPPTVIYAHTGFAALRLLPIAEALRVPLVAHFHGLDINITDPAYIRALRVNLSRLAKIIVVADWMVPFFEEAGIPHERIAVLPMGVDTARFATLINATPPPRSPKKEPARFVFAGRLVPYKGVDRTLRALAQLWNNGGKAVLRIIGEGPERARLEALASELELEEATTFLGARTVRDTYAEIAAADALVHHAVDEPGGPEAFGVVVTEAMALARPVIATRCGGIPSQVVDGESGYLVAQENIAAMAAAMSRIAADPALGRRLGTVGRRIAETRFDTRMLTDRLEEEVFLPLVAERGR